MTRLNVLTETLHTSNLLSSLSIYYNVNVWTLKNNSLKYPQVLKGHSGNWEMLTQKEGGIGQVEKRR